jgi:hypothetical protein
LKPRRRNRKWKNNPRRKNKRLRKRLKYANRSRRID